MKATLNYLRKNFTYKKDSTRGSSWRIMDIPYEGDCEDFALTALYTISGERMREFWGKLWRKEYSIYHVTHNGNGHAMLYHRGSDMYTCNITKMWMHKSSLPPRFKIKKRRSIFYVAKMMLASKIWRSLGQ